MIVLGTDFSEDSLLALTLAEQLSDMLSTTVRVVYVNPHADSALPDSATQWLQNAGLESSDVVLRTGTPWLELLRFAEEHDAQMICVAAHGESGYQAMTTGTNTRRLLVRSSVPVIVAPAVAKPHPTKPR